MSNDMWDAKAEAQRLINDPEHLRRKAAWIRKQIGGGGVLSKQRRARANELEAQADKLDTP